jgi:hypothetical protein
MLNSVLLEGVVEGTPIRTNRDAVNFNIRHTEDFSLPVIATGVLGSESLMYLRNGMFIRIVGKLGMTGLELQHLEFKGRGLS